MVRDFTEILDVHTALLEVNTLRTGEADLHFYITTVQDG